MRLIFKEYFRSMLGLMLALFVGFSGSAYAASALVPEGASINKTDKTQQSNVAPDYAALAALLEDPKSRAVLIKELQRLAKESPDQGDLSSKKQVDVQPTLANEMAVDTLSLFHAIGDGSMKALAQFNRLLHVNPISWDWSQLGEHTWRLVVLIIFAYGIWLAFWRLFQPMFQRLNRWSSTASVRQHLLRLSLSLGFIAALGLAVLGLVFFLGNVLSATLANGMESALWRQTLFLNAFIVIEFSNLVIGLVLTPSFNGLRLFPTNAEQAKFWMRRSSLLIRVLGYGLMWLVPVTRHNWGVDAAQIVMWSLATLGLLYALQTVFSQRRVLRGALLSIAERHASGVVSWLLNALAHTWHLLAILYIGMVFLVGLMRPTDALPLIIKGTGYTVLIVLGALLSSTIVAQMIGREVRLKEQHRKWVPLLERRLNTYLPWVVRAIRLGILLVALALILWVWDVSNVFTWLGSVPGQQFLGIVFDVVFILLGSLIVWLVASSLIEMKLNDESDHIPSARMQTLLSLFRNAVAIALLAMAVMMVLSEIGVNIGPLLAGAGVLGLAVGFGAQKLVQDVITGVFIQIENAINTGDYVTAGGASGTAERISIRSVGLRDLSGTYHIVPFSAVDVVSNFAREYAYHTKSYGIAYRENIDEAIEHLKAAFEELKTDPAMKGLILAPISIPGVTELGASSVDIRVMIKTAPGMQWAVGRAYNRLVKMHFDAAGIEIPFPHTTLYCGEDKSGKAPPAYIRQLDNDSGDHAVGHLDDRSGEKAEPAT
jgi:small conductance mechanosensitive channel